MIFNDSLISFQTAYQVAFVTIWDFIRGRTTAAARFQSEVDVDLILYGLYTKHVQRYSGRVNVEEFASVVCVAALLLAGP